MKNNDPVIVEYRFDSPIERVWQALTDKDQMKTWYFDLPEFKPEPGFQFEFDGGDGNRTFRHLCRITEVIPGKALAYTWRYQGYAGDSLVNFTLFPEGEKTLLRLTHSGLETFPENEPALAKANFVAGWKHIIQTSLKNFLENTEISKSIEINALPATVWDVLVNPQKNRTWTQVFSAGTYPESNWQQDSEVLWKDNAGHLATKGVIDVSEPGSRLKISFYEEASMTPPAPTGPYAETYLLTAIPTGTLLQIQAGPLPARSAASHGAVWEQVLETIKNLAEEKPGNKTEPDAPAGIN